MKKKDLLRAVCFALLLGLILSAAGRIYTPKTGSTGSGSETFKNLPKDSVDVIFSGASGIMADVAPTVIWDEYGITGYNISSSAQIALTTYYSFKEALMHHTPKLFVIDAKGLLNTCDVDDEYFGPYTRHVFDEMKMSGVKAEAILDIAKQSEKETIFSLLFPVLRYHERTPEIRSVDFIRAYGYEYSRDTSYLGHLFSGKVVCVEPIVPIDSVSDTSGSDAPDEAVVASESDVFLSDGGSSDHVLDDNAVRYYEKILDLCKEKGIEVLLLKIPAPRWTIDDYNAVNEFAQQHGIGYIDLNLSEYLDEIALDYENDFKDPLHLNSSGAEKVSRVLGRELADSYALEDQRHNSAYAVYDRFDGYFREAMTVYTASASDAKADE